MDKKERKEFDIETLKEEFVAVEIRKTIYMGLSMLMCVFVIYITV